MTSMHSRTHSRLLRSLLIGSSLLCLAGCNDGSGDPKAQLGSNPVLPDQQQYWLPPMHIARVVGWKKDETPTAAQGCIRAAPVHERLLLVYENHQQCGGALPMLSDKPAQAGFAANGP